MFWLSVFAAFVLSTFVEAGGLRDQLQTRRAGGGLARDQQVRVCNAYSQLGAADVRHVQSRSAASGGGQSLQYKSCRDFRFSIEVGDKIEFAVGDAVLGVFVVTELPQSGCMLLLVVQRHPSDTFTAMFESHAFADVHSAQLAVIDAYGGETISVLALKSQGRGRASRDLRFGSVLRLSPGRYKVELARRDEEPISTGDFEARDGETYIVFRVGAKHSPGFPEAIVVFPSVFDERKLQSVACSSSSITVTLFGVLFSLSSVW